MIIFKEVEGIELRNIPAALYSLTATKIESNYTNLGFTKLVFIFNTWRNKINCNKWRSYICKVLFLLELAKKAQLQQIWVFGG